MPDRCDRRCSTVTPSSISGQIAAEDGAGGRRELEHAFLDQAHDGESRETFRPARESESRVHRVGDPEATMRKAVRPRELDPVALVNPNDTREPCLGRKRVELAPEIRHAADASPCVHPAAECPGSPSRALPPSGHIPAHWPSQPRRRTTRP